MQGEPKVTTCAKLGAFPSNISMGNMRLGLALQGLRFNTKAAYITASPQKCIGKRQINIMHRAIFKTVRYIRSALPFDAGLSASVRCRPIPLLAQNRSMLAYSPPPSVRNICTRQ